jgi:hypothetical protein
MQKLGHLWKKNEETASLGNLFTQAAPPFRSERRSFQYVTKYGGTASRALGRYKHPKKNGLTLTKSEGKARTLALNLCKVVIKRTILVQNAPRKCRKALPSG